MAWSDQAGQNHATLKRFSRMGDNILLLAENPQYDPVMLNEDQVSILGIAVGLIKQKSRGQ